MQILVGYISSQMVKQLSRASCSVVLDNLFTSFLELARYGQLVIGGLTDTHLLERQCRGHAFDEVMQFICLSSAANFSEPE